MVHGRTIRSPADTRSSFAVGELRAEGVFHGLTVLEWLGREVVELVQATAVASLHNSSKARKCLREIEVTRQREECADPEAGEPRLATASAAWLAGQNSKNARTYAQYETRVQNHIDGPLGSLKLRGIKPSTTIEWITGDPHTPIGDPRPVRRRRIDQPQPMPSEVRAQRQALTFQEVR